MQKIVLYLKDENNPQRICYWPNVQNCPMQFHYFHVLWYFTDCAKYIALTTRIVIPFEKRLPIAFLITLMAGQ